MNDYPVKNFTQGRPWGIKNIVIHHVAGIATASQIAYTLNSRGVSAHYGIGNDGSLGKFVDEGNRAWHAGDGVGVQSRGNDMGVGIEVSNSEVGGDWKVSEQSFGLLVDLVKDIAKRNGLLPLKVGGNLLAHRDLSQTQCPGNFLYGRLQELADKVNAEPKPEPQPEPTPEPEYYIVKAGDTLGQIALDMGWCDPNELWGADGYVNRLAKHNGISNPNLIFPDQKIVKL